jgi:ABC-type branched-subunit amino acid transport system permease subunit
VTLVLPAFLPGYRMVTLTGTVAMVLVFVSLSLLVGLSRQVSLCHSVFLVFGATTLAKFLDAGIPYVVALPLSAAVFIPIGALIAIPSIRLSGLYLALATFAFAVLSQDLLFTTRFAFGETQLVKIPRPGFLVGDTRFLYFVLAVVVLGVVAVEAVRVSRLGQILVALADSPKAVQSLGISPLVARVLTFCLSAFLAALAGGLLGTLVQTVSQDTYPAFLSLVWLAVLVTAGARTLSGSILAAVLYVAVPAVFTSHYFSPVYMALYLGAGAILYARTPNGIAGMLRLPDFKALAQKTGWRLEAKRSAERYARTVTS